MPAVITSPRRRLRPSAPTTRFGRILRRLRWPTVIIWIFAIVLLHPLAGTLYQVTNDTAAANLPSSAQSTQVAVIQSAAQQHGLGSGGKVQQNIVAVLFVRTSGLTAADRAAVGSASAAVAGLVGSTGGLGSPSETKESGDIQALIFTATVTAPVLNQTNIDATAVAAIRAAVLPAGHDGLRVLVTGPAAVTADSGSTSQTTLLLTALLVVGLILLVVYRGVVLWVFPLLGALAGIVVAQAAAHGLAAAGLTVSSLSTSILIVLAFGAASDYALLLIHRYRDELRRHAGPDDAMAAALRRTTPTLLASAATVVGAMLCLLAAQPASLHGLGPVGAAAIASALLAQLTFLPALLLVFGRVAFWPRASRLDSEVEADSGLWARIGQRVAPARPDHRRRGCAAGRGLRRAARPAHRQQLVGQPEGPAGQCGRR